MIGQLVKKLRLVEERIAHRETAWRSDFELSKESKAINEDAVSRHSLEICSVIVYIPRRERGDCWASFRDCCFQKVEEISLLSVLVVLRQTCRGFCL
jgi:hypothetical protein